MLAKKIIGSQAAGTSHPAVVRSGCVQTENVLMRALLLWKGYRPQPAVIPDNSVQTVHRSLCICSFRGVT